MVKLAVRVAASLAAIVLAAAAQAQPAAGPNPDLDFARQAASGGHAEVELGRLALSKSANANVRQFAQRMVNDHTKANLQLSELAQREHLRLRRTAEGGDAAHVRKLSGLSGANFDRSYMDRMVEGHQQDLEAFQHEADQGQDAQIRTLAQATLPTLKEHLRLAQQVQGSVGEEKAQLPSGSRRKHPASPQ